MTIIRYIPLLSFLIACGTPLPLENEVTSAFLKIPTRSGKIATTLSRKKGATAPRPGIIMIPAAPGDRDWNLGPLVTNSGLLLARHLAFAGYLVLRLDPPGRGQSVFNGELTRKTASDAIISAHKFLQKQPGCRGEEIYWLAHGDAAFPTLLAGQQTKPEGIILLSPPGQTMGKTLLLQIKDSLQRRGVSRDKTAALLSHAGQAIEALISGKSRPNTIKGSGAEMNNAIIRLFNTKQIRYTQWIMGRSPVSLVSSGYRLLAIHGGRDAQYPPQIHKSAWKRCAVCRHFTIPDMDYMAKTQSGFIDTLSPRAILKSYTDQGRPISLTLLKKLTQFISHAEKRKE